MHSLLRRQKLKVMVGGIILCMVLSLVIFIAPLEKILLVKKPERVQEGTEPGSILSDKLTGFVVVDAPVPEQGRFRQGQQGEALPSLLTTNQKFIEALYTKLDVNDVEQVFHYVFSCLPNEVYVYPTENYYYFSFYASRRWFWGNIRLDAEDRERGILNFVYYEYIDNPQSPDDTPIWLRRFGPADGVIVRKRSVLRYAVTYEGKTVIFTLNKITQEFPKLFKLREDEEFLARTFDESGFRFFLLFNKTHAHFMWVLNEEEGGPELLEPLTEELVWDKLSGFVFWVSPTDNRKILIGIWAQNIRRNNYWDGPFDQLADNYVHPKLAEYIQRAYPYTKGRIDRYGKFTDEPGMRVAITPYREYESPGELFEVVSDCKRQPLNEFCPCITYDYKTSMQ